MVSKRLPRTRQSFSKRHSNQSAMQRLYGARAPSYDAELQPFEPLRALAIQRLELQPGQSVLDIGCGTGLSFEPLLASVGVAGKVTGIEQNADMLSKARQRLQGLGRTAQRQVQLIESPVDVAKWSGPKADAAIFHFTHDIALHPASVAHVMDHLKAGAHVVATGLQWAPPWLLPVNMAVMGCALYSVSSLHGLLEPWRELEAYLDDFAVESIWMGSIYMASGKRRTARMRNTA